MGLVPLPQYLGDSVLHPRNTECRSGQGIESIPRFQRLETSSRGFQPPPSEVGSPEYRSFCLSSLSYQLDQFVSWRPDPLEIHTDAFTLDWATFRGYAFPPFARIGRCLHRIQSQQVAHMVLVAQVWPAEPWYPLLLELCIDFPLLLPVQEDLLTQRNRTHPLKHLQLAGWLLSAEVSKRQTFLHRVENSSWQPGGKIQLVPIPSLGQNGVAGVVNRSMLIPFYHL